MNCYVVNPKKSYVLPEGMDKENTLFFPEQSMSYGCSLSIIHDEIFGITSSIPAAIVSRKLVTNCMGRGIK